MSARRAVHWLGARPLVVGGLLACSSLFANPGLAQTPASTSLQLAGAVTPKTSTPTSGTQSTRAQSSGVAPASRGSIQQRQLGAVGSGAGQSSSGTTSAQHGSAQSGSGKQNARLTGLNLFAELARTQDRVALRGDRIYTLYRGGPTLLRFAERVRVGGVDGNGRVNFAIHGVGVHDESGSPLPLESKAQDLTEGYVYHYRDFRVQDPRRAKANYVARSMGRLRISGRVVEVFDIHPRRQGLCGWRILVDEAHRIVLDQIRMAPDGSVLSTLFWNPSSLLIGAAAKQLNANEKWWKPWVHRVDEHRTLGDGIRAAGFGARPPSRLDRGFELAAVRTTQLGPTDPINLVLAFDNGIATRFLLQSKQTVSTKPPPMGKGRQPDVPVFHWSFGPSEQFLARYKGIQYLAVGVFPGSGVPPLLEHLLR